MARFALRTLVFSIFGSVALLLVQGCTKADSDSSAASDSRFKVIVSVPPQADFVRRVGGDHVKVDVLVGLGQDPHSFSPTPAQMAVVSEADLFVTVGMPFEEDLQHRIETANSGLKVVSMSEGFEKIPSQCDHPSHASEEEGHGHGGEGHGHGEEDHGHGEEDHGHGEEDHGHGEEGHGEEGHGHHHDHGEDDPHVWLSPPLVKVQAANIAAALREALPAHEAEFVSNLEVFQTELDALHRELEVLLEDRTGEGEQFFVFHPAFGYFGYTYDIEQVAVEVNGNEPTPNELAEFIEQAKDQGMKTIFVQPQFDDRSAKIIADQLGARVESLDPLDPDVLANIRRIAEAIAGTQ